MFVSFFKYLYVFVLFNFLIVFVMYFFRYVKNVLRSVVSSYAFKCFKYFIICKYFGNCIFICNCVNNVCNIFVFDVCVLFVNFFINVIFSCVVFIFVTKFFKFSVSS